MRVVSLILVLGSAVLSANEIGIFGEWRAATFVVENRYGDVTVIATPEDKITGKLTVFLAGREITNPREEEQIIGAWTYLFGRNKNPKAPEKVLIDVRPRFYAKDPVGHLVVHLPVHALRDLKVSAKGNISVSGFNVPAENRVFALSAGGKLSLHDNAIQRLVTSLGQIEEEQSGDCSKMIGEFSEIETLLQQRFTLPPMY